MKAYKLVRKRKDGSLGSLFINRKKKLPIGEWIESESHETKGYKFRPGWHCLKKPEAPHLTEKGRVWVEVEVRDYTEHVRPESQGGEWLLASQMKIISEMA